MNSRQIEIAIARFFNYRMNIIVPNVSWGLFNYFEIDLLIIRPSCWAMEIEIKISAADIKKDLAKRRYIWEKQWPREFELIQRKYFAVPEKLYLHPDIPARFGIIAINDSGGAKIMRPAQINKNARKLTDAEIKQALRLGCMRIWSLKEALNENQERKGDLDER